jgi:ribose-phosphate pyrophosphokinase
MELKKNGAKDVYVCATHGVLSKNAIEKLSVPEIKQVYLTDSMKIPEAKRIPKIKIVSLAPFISELITSIFEGEPMGVIVEEKYEKVKGN